MITKRPYALSIAGLDPSGGAGLYADIKTFEHFKVQGLGVCTAITHQNENSCSHIDWQSSESILGQLNELSHLPVKWIKIGIVQNSSTLIEVLEQIKKNIFPEAKIIWDPVLKSSSGTSFIQLAPEDLMPTLSMVDVFMPNWPEAMALSNNNEEQFTAWSEHCTVFIKGGHREDKKGKDILIENGKSMSFMAKKWSPWGKRGTGCTLSSALCANLSKELSLHRAILKSKRYVESILNSNPSSYGWYRL